MSSFLYESPSQTGGVEIMHTMRIVKLGLEAEG